MDFGSLRKAYDSGRQDYPKDVIEHIISIMTTNAKVLDVGCGTGIGTRQLYQKLDDISGCDIDAKMIESAASYEDSIPYTVSQTANMPFRDKLFDNITSFGAFHWFCDGESISEIRRVLKEGGHFIVINKEEVGTFRKDYENIIESVIGSRPPQSIKADYKPVSILKENGFFEVREKVFTHTEEFSISRAIEQAQSMNTWNAIPKNKEAEAIQECREYFERIAKNGVVHRELRVIVVSGKKR